MKRSKKMMFAVCAMHNGSVVHIGDPFPKDRLNYMLKLIQVPVATGYRVFQPEEMWVEMI